MLDVLRHLGQDRLVDLAELRVLAVVGLLRRHHVGRLGERVVAQAHDHQLGRQRLLGVPGRALRLAATALGARRHVEQALPGEVLDPAHAVGGVVRRVLQVQALPVGVHGQQRAQRVGPSRGAHVDRGGEDVQVLAVAARSAGSPGSRPHAATARWSRARRWRWDRAGRAPCDCRDGDETAGHSGGLGVAGVLLEVDLRAAVQGQGRDDQEDHGQDEPRARGVGAVEPRPAALLAGLVAQPDDQEDHDADEHQQDEQVLEEPDDRPRSDEREREPVDEQFEDGLDDGQAQDQEAAEHEDVRDAGDAPLEQLLLPQHLGDLGLEPGGGLAGAVRPRGWPDRIRLVRNPARFSAKNAATKMMTMPTPARSAIDGSMAPPKSE